MKNNFYDDSDLERIDREIEESLNRPTLVENMQTQNDQAKAKRESLANEIRQYWYVYIPLAVSSVFTAMLGIYMGLAPTLAQNSDGSRTINFNTDWGHLLTGLVYVTAFLYVTEVSFAIFLRLFHNREENNTPQFWSMLIGMILSGISIIGTGWSGGAVVANVLGFLTEFQEIPHSAQRWVVSIIPVMLGLHAMLYAIFKLSSRRAKAKRLANEADAEMELDFEMREKSIARIGKRRMQAAAIKMFEGMVMDGLLSQSEATWAIGSGLSVAEIEKKLGRDLTGEGKIGDTSGFRDSGKPIAPKSPISRCLNCDKPLPPGYSLCNETCEREYYSKAPFYKAEDITPAALGRNGNGTGKHKDP